MRRSMLLGGLAALVAVPALGQDEPAVGLGGFVLGQTVDQAKTVPIVGLLEDKSYSFVCTGEEEAPFSVSVSPAERAEGISRCTAAYRDVFRDEDLGWRSTAMKFGDLLLDPEFRFKDGTLYEISAIPHMNFQQQLTDALTLKYGPPTEMVQGEASNAFGAKWPTVRSKWQQGTKIIELAAPAGRRDQMLLVVSDTAVAEDVDAKLRARRAQATGI